MKIKIRRSCQSDIEQIYDLHARCFSQSDHWYKSNIGHYLDNGIVIETKDTNKIIGVLLQGSITPCNQAFNADNSSSNFSLFASTDTDTNTDQETQTKTNTGLGYKADEFNPINDTGKFFLTNSLQFKELYGIVMLCIDNDFRGKGLGKKLIEKHWQDNSNKILCLNTRRSNISAYTLYKKMGYEHIAFIKNKYFQPNEDSIFMIKDLTQTVESVK